MRINQIQFSQTPLLTTRNDDSLQTASSRKVQQACESCIKCSFGAGACATGVAIPVVAWTLPNPFFVKLILTCIGCVGIEVGLDCMNSALRGCPCGNGELPPPTRPPGIE